MNDSIEHTDLEIGCKYLLLKYDESTMQDPVSYVGTFKKYIHHSTLNEYPITSPSVVYSMFVNVFDYKRQKYYKNMCISSHYSPFIILIYKHNIPSLQSICFNSLDDNDKSQLLNTFDSVYFTCVENL